MAEQLMHLNSTKRPERRAERAFWRHVIAWPGLLLGVGFILHGMSVENTTQWRLSLLTGLWLVSLAPRALLATHTPVVIRGMVRLALVLALGFSAVGLQLTRNQITQAEPIREQAAAILEPTPLPDPALATPVPAVIPMEAVLSGEPTPQVPTSTPMQPADRVWVGSNRTWPVEVAYGERGAIFDRNGVLLALSENGRRVYPDPSLAHIVGFQSTLYGLSGIEERYDYYLSGAYSLSTLAMLEARLLDTSPVTTRAADVHLTLNSNLQWAAQNALGGRRGAVVVLDPRDGAILALATFPRFDPNMLVLGETPTEADVAAVRANWEALAGRADGPLVNRATQGRYPPGSIIKTFTAAAALDSGVVPFPESQVTCPNRLPTETGAPPVRNAVEGLAAQTGNPSNLRLVYAWSCNTAFAQIGLLLGPEIFLEYAEQFGLYTANAAGAAPDLQDIPADASTIAGSAAFLQRRAALADTAFGQGEILVTPLDMAQMVAVVANNGALMRPYLVSEVRADGQALYTAQPEVLRQVIAPATAERMRSIMQTSVEVGYAAPAAIRGVQVGGKTGTAEVPSGAPHSWFVAIAPLDQPRFAVAVVIENGGEGSQAALPVARQVLLAALR